LQTHDLTRSEGIFESLESGINVNGGIPTLLKSERHSADALRGYDGGSSRLGGVRAPCDLKKLFDFVDVIAAF
jgi:hypothetical protein